MSATRILREGANRQVVLVHGTFARNAPWTLDGSALRNAVRGSSEADVHFHAFPWSGLPSHLARYNAGLRLKEFIKKLKEKFPLDEVFIIGHSHGGMVALYSAGDEFFDDQVDGIITLSTPFLIPHKRNWNVLGLISLFSIIAVLLLSVIGLSTFIFEFK